jgi:transposase
VRTAPRIELARGERAKLLELARDATLPARVTLRARMVLEASEGRTDRAIALKLGVAAGTVATWRRRFLAQRVPGVVREAPRSGRPPTLTPGRIQEIVRMTLGRRPAGGGPWTSRRLARETGVSKTTIQRIWRAHQIEPSRAAETLRRNPGAKFVENVTDLVGLYYHPPDRAMAFSVDERGGNGGGLPLAPASSLRAEEGRRAHEFRSFLQAIDRETPPQLDVHLLLDGRLAPTSPEVRRWLGHHPRFYLHFLPPDARGPNVIDRWWAGFARSRLRPGATPGVQRLRRAFRHHFSLATAVGRAFVWTATKEEVRPGGRRPLPPRRTRASSAQP